jgi:hypothetical protein
VRWTRALALALLAPGSASAEDYVGLYGSYYKELSTRVVSPMVTISKDLPLDANATVSYLVDQITSASAAFTQEDAAFQEYRHEIRLDAGMRFLEMLEPRVGFRYSKEPDYESLGFSGRVGLDLFEETMTLGLEVHYLRDSIGMRPAPNQQIDPNAEQFRGKLETVNVLASISEVLTPWLIAGLSFEAQVLRGFQENIYRVEQHPEDRNRYAAGVWAAVRIDASRTTVRADYRFYADTWKLFGHSAELRVNQRIVAWFEVEPRIRLHFQDAVFFVDPITIEGETFRTEDPKLMKFSAQTFGLQLTFRLSFFHDTALELFEDTLIQPYYAYLRQTNRYGDAHIAQLGLFWPF